MLLQVAFEFGGLVIQDRMREIPLYSYVTDLRSCCGW